MPAEKGEVGSPNGRYFELEATSLTDFAPRST
jgi:hypothetical protein